MKEKYKFNEENPQHPYESKQEKWLRAVGGVSHGRIYGVGSMIDVATVHASKCTKRDDFHAPLPPHPPEAPQPVYTQEEVNALLLNERQCNQEDINRRIFEERRRNFDQMSVIYRQIALEPPPMDEVSIIYTNK